MNGVLLVNLGTPETATPADVAAYLTEFLSDSRVIDFPRWLWLPVLRLIVIPLRRRRTAEAYRKIWTPQGSPLMVFSKSLADKLREALWGKAEITLAMRYGQPGVRTGLEVLKETGVESLVVLPLYPQYSGTTTEAVFDAVEVALREMDWFPQLQSIQKYHDVPGWAKAVGDSIRKFQQKAGKPDKLLFSLHGIPQRYVSAGDPYAAQCEQSVADIALNLGLARDEWLLSYQSRVGREPWLQPYTAVSLAEMAALGVKNVQVVCPGFAVDCLETLEEIEIQNRKLFMRKGGERFDYIPALNDTDPHVTLLSNLIQQAFS